MKYEKFFKIVVNIIFLSLFFITNNLVSQGEWKVVNTTTKPEARFGHSLTTLPDGQVLLYGGENSSQDMYNDLYSYDNSQWSPETPQNMKLTPRAGHSIWFINGKVYVHGGRGKDQSMGEKLLKDTWSYNPQKKEWSEVKTVTSPGPRSEHKASSHPDGYALISGG